MTRTFWLSFCDAERPKGQQFLGACLVDVSQSEADDAAIVVAETFPHAQDGAEWIAAASRHAWRVGCNPGGEIASVDVTDGPPEVLALYPRDLLLSKAQLEAFGPLERMSL